MLLDYYFYLSQYMLQQKFLNVSFIKSTILKLEQKTKNILETLLFCILNILHIKRLALIATEI